MFCLGLEAWFALMLAYILHTFCPIIGLTDTLPTSSSQAEFNTSMPFNELQRLRAAGNGVAEVNTTGADFNNIKKDKSSQSLLHFIVYLGVYPSASHTFEQLLHRQ